MLMAATISAINCIVPEIIKNTATAAVRINALPGTLNVLIAVKAVGRILSRDVPKRIRVPRVCSALWDEGIAAHATRIMKVTPNAPLYLPATVA